jgi:murein DD-endopeptidase MepM/ murein hydrolase activator NlpD
MCFDLYRAEPPRGLHGQMAGQGPDDSRPRGLLIAGVVMVLPVLFLTGLFGGVMMGLFGPDDSGCLDGGTDGGIQRRAPAEVGGLSPAQLANANAIITEGLRMHVPSKGIVIALATASQESHFTNYANDGRGGDLLSVQDGIAASLSLPHEAVGTDHGSLGVFQQQWPWWGSMRELMTPAVAAQKFYRALLSMPAWQSEPVTFAAQSVQASAHPEAYADDEPLARELLGLSGPKGMTTDRVVSAAALGSADCASGEGAPGQVVFPLPQRSGFRDARNFGRAGAHWASVHTGDDLSVACGTPVLAATDGTAIIRTDQRWAGRWLVQVSTGSGQLTTWYAHMRALTVTEGQVVRAGQQIGEVGDLGNATGCHLHFEVHPHGGTIYQDSVDPIAWLRAHIGASPVGGSVRSAAWPATGDSFTVATFNTLGTSHTVPGRSEHPGMATGPVRTRGLVQILEQNRVDVVGLQEFQGPQAAAFAQLAGSTYDTWHTGQDTENSIAWRRSRWLFVAATSVSIPYFNGHLRQMPVVRLRDRLSGRDVTFLNVHNPADTGRFRNQGHWRSAAVTKEIALVRSLSESGSPVIMVGDLNDRRDAYRRLNSAAGLVAYGVVADTPSRPTGRAGIDWIMGSSHIQFSGHTRDRGPVVRATTDHPVLLALARVVR